MSEARRADHPAAEAVRRRIGQAEPTDERQAACRRLGDAARLAIDRLVATTAPVEVLLRAARDAETLAEHLGQYEPTRRYEGVAEAAGAGPDPLFFDWSPLAGLSNPLAPPVEMAIEGDRVVGQAQFGSAYEGPPGCVHGGFVAAAFDEVLGMTQSLSGQTGMTGTLRIRYRQPTPLHTPLRFEGWVVRVEGRKVLTRATVSADGAVTADAEGLFVAVSAERFAAYAGNRARRWRRDDRGEPAG
jgi:acyl-coenzyme A thioesterase PaaI-like protein